MPKGILAKTGSNFNHKKTAEKHIPPVDAPKTWYDYPHYYDLGFKDDSVREAKFFEKAFAKYVQRPVKKIFEPGCGSGRLIVEMSARGYRTTGLDLNDSALTYCREQLDKKALKAKLVKGDMTHFEFKHKFDAAFNTINTFRHLLTEEAAIQHLKCVADSLRSGGIFILGLHLLPKDAEFFGTERWKAKQGRTSVSYNLVVVDSKPKERIEKLKITMTIRVGTKKPVKVSDELILRLYNYRQMKELLSKVPEFQLRDVYDFWYQIDEPQKFDNKLADAVFILQKT